MFDNHTKEQLKEWNGTKTVERTIKIDKVVRTRAF